MINFYLSKKTIFDFWLITLIGDGNLLTGTDHQSQRNTSNKESHKSLLFRVSNFLQLYLWV